MERKLFILAVGFLLLAALTAADIDDYQCRILFEHDASVRGNVSSPFYGERKYHNGLWCEYRIRAPEGYAIKITFKDLDIEPSSGCRQDYLMIWGKDKRNVLGNFCSSQIPYPLVSEEGDSEFRLLFRTDFMGAGRGFLLEYESSPTMELCESGYTQCSNRNCYKTEKKCDGIDDCGDGTDEENCKLPVTEAEECGLQKFLPKTIFPSPDRMVGGEEVVQNSWPWQVSLQSKFSEPNGHFCGGTLLNSQWVLTATHCVAPYPKPTTIKVVLGSHGKFTKTSYEQTRSAVKVIAYPDFEGEEMARNFNVLHDMALVKLNAPVTFNDGVQPACLPDSFWKNEPGTICYITGWGETRGTGGSDVLKQMEQVVLSQKNCSFNEETQICLKETMKGPCHGDSGGPLHCRLGSRWFVFGAASYVTLTNFITGICGGPDAFNVYASVPGKYEWIKTTIEKYT